MKIDILTLFPNMFSCLNESILGRAQEKNLLEINVVNIRDFSKDKHKKCDDAPFGGGAGMVMMAQPICDAFDSLDITEDTCRIYVSPKGKRLDQNLVKQLAQKKHLVLLCGHYEGVDQRALDLNIDMEVSIGDYVLTGGEIPAMVIVDSVSRFVPEVLGSAQSAEDESFSDNLLEYPQYTRPQNYRGLEVPQILLSGNHGKIDEWRYNQKLEITKEKRPDLLKKD
ncbi:MAG: tRNA (guanosine(37)-N1)-methyltransferase TrmD [Clostridiales bacterium]|nr:tRNA (guanosine(37)-N1)-methyltransferase TrmD [Clostridiales bacterium]